MANEFKVESTQDGLTTLVVQILTADGSAQIGADIPLTQAVAGGLYVGDLPAGLAEGEYPWRAVNTANGDQADVTEGTSITIDATGAPVTLASVNTKQDANAVQMDALLATMAALGQDCADASGTTSTPPDNGDTTATTVARYLESPAPYIASQPSPRTITFFSRLTMPNPIPGAERFFMASLNGFNGPRFRVQRITATRAFLEFPTGGKPVAGQEFWRVQSDLGHPEFVDGATLAVMSSSQFNGDGTSQRFAAAVFADGTVYSNNGTTGALSLTSNPQTAEVADQQFNMFANASGGNLFPVTYEVSMISVGGPVIDFTDTAQTDIFAPGGALGDIAAIRTAMGGTLVHHVDGGLIAQANGQADGSTIIDRTGAVYTVRT